MKRSPQSNRALSELQNKFRGLISAFKSQRYVLNRTASSSQRFRSGLRDLQLIARVVLPPFQFNDFLAWIDFQVATQIPNFQNIPVEYEELTGISTQSPVATLERELLWITARIKANATRCNTFRTSVNEIERLVFSDRVEEAIEGLKHIESVFGSTLWSVQLRIALEQQVGGLERQKRYTAEVRSVYKRGLLGFIAYHTSVRNEERSTLAKYCDDIKVRIENHRYYQPFVKTYVRYRLAGEWPDSESGFADILRAEQSHSLIDLYETYISVIQELIRRDDFIKVHDVIAKCIHELSAINDFRLIKAARLLNGGAPLPALGSRSTEISDPLFLGEVKLAVRAAQEYWQLPGATDPWDLIYAGLAFAHTRRILALGELNRPKDIPKLIGRILSRSDDQDDSFARLGKLAINLRGLPASSAMLDLLCILRPSRPEESLRPWLVSLNSPTVGIEDFPPHISYKEMDIPISEVCPTEQVWAFFRGAGSANSNLSQTAVMLFSSEYLLRGGEFQLAKDTLNSLKIGKEEEPARSIVVSMLLRAHLGAGSRQAVIELVADEGSRGEANRRSIPILQALEHYQWPDYKTVPSPLARPIALHLLWSINESDKTAATLRFSVGEFLRNSGVARPSMLTDQLGTYPLHQLVYFLRDICVTQILEVSRAFKNTREVMEERLSICSVLRELDVANSQKYHDEILSISNALVMDEGQWIVDSSRVYVDSEALARWATKSISEDYARYGDLLSVDVGSKQSFDDVLKEIIATPPGQRSEYVPENEADAVLVSILHRVGDEFMHNPSFGFDFYLSKRIRHQSFIGLIRGPLEFANLITTRGSELGDYHRNDFWMDKFGASSAEDRSVLNAALVKFSKTFDDALIVAKDKKFHVYSQENPSGLFYLALTPRLMSLAHALVKMDNSLPLFIRTIISLLWVALEPSLLMARLYISNDLKIKIAAGFDELRATARTLTEHGTAILDFDVAIGEAARQVQRALDDVTTWFTHADFEATKRFFTLNQAIDISLDAVLKCQRTFEPQIIRHVETENAEISLAASSLVFVHDVLFIALDNARMHSGLKTPNVNVNAKSSLDDGTLTIEVISDTKPQNRISQDEVVQEIRGLIDRGDIGRRTRREGRSGILKLAAVVKQTSKGKIDFGFTDDNRFKLKITYSMLVLEGD